MARSTRLVILIKNLYTLWGRKRFLRPVTYLPTNLVYPFTLQVTGIITNFNLTNASQSELIFENKRYILASAIFHQEILLNEGHYTSVLKKYRTFYNH